MEDFRDPRTARNWNADPLTHNPTRKEQLDILLSILESEYRPGTAILDVGFGSGIVEGMIFERIPGSQVVGLDGSPAMVELANERLALYQGRYEVVIHDLMEISTAQLPPHEYGVVISVQTIHNVPDRAKREAFDFVCRTLESGGLFLLLDRIAIDTPGLFDVYQALWKRLGEVHGARIEGREGVTFEEHRQILATRGDQPATLEQHLQWLRESGFDVACVHLHGNRALFAARKR